jgi:dihydrofolate synthase/folylpolyglutamate synthase
VTLDQWLARIEQMHPAEIELGLDRISAVATRMYLLPLQSRSIVVAGTNGKGSTVALIDALARDAGLRTGVYTSPHLIRFNERVRINGTPVDDASLCRAFDAIEVARGDIKLTYFEFTTLAALYLFRNQELDLCILEVGLGGRLDAVNLVDADVAIITSIGLDHTDWLGDSRELIAVEKAGVSREGQPLLFAGIDMPSTVAQLCEADNVPLLIAGQAFAGANSNVSWLDRQGNTQRLSLGADIPLGEDNLAGAVQALALLGFLRPDRVATVASRVSVPGRRQSFLIDDVEWVLDVGHNAEALQRFCVNLSAAKGETYALVAMLADKPAEKALATFVPEVSHWYLAGLSGARGQSAEQLRCSLPPELSVGGCFASVAEAVSVLRETVSPSDRVLVFGSFFTVAEAAEALAIALE